MGSLAVGQVAPPYVFTQVEKGDNTIAGVSTSGLPLSTYNFCCTYKNKTSPWKIPYIGPPRFNSGSIVNIAGMYPDKYWCFMTGVASGSSNFNAGLELPIMTPIVNV